MQQVRAEMISFQVAGAAMRNNDHDIFSSNPYTKGENEARRGDARAMRSGCEVRVSSLFRSDIPIIFTNTSKYEHSTSQSRGNGSMPRIENFQFALLAWGLGLVLVLSRGIFFFDTNGGMSVSPSVNRSISRAMGGYV